MKATDLRNYPDRTLLAYLEDPVVVVTARGKILYFNPSFQSRFRVDRKIATGSPLSDTLPRWMWEPIYEQLKGMGPDGAIRRFWINRDQESFRASMSGIVLKGRVAGAVITIWDAGKETRIKRRNLELFRSMLGDLGYPLEEAKTISGGTGAISSVNRDKIKGHINSLHESLLRLREFGEIFLGDIRAERVPFYPGRLAKMALKTLRPMSEQKGVYLEDGTLRELTRVLGDPALINRVLGLLVDYMIRLVPSDEMVVLACELLLMEDGSPRLAYSVTGTGVANPEAERRQSENILDSYGELSDEKKRSALRIYLAHKLVSAMGGVITLAAHELAGTTISVVVPVEIHFISGE